MILDLAEEIGCRLAVCGAEIYRVEESVARILEAYGMTAEVFAIPNCLHICANAADGQTWTRMKRIPYIQNDLDGVERYANLGRRICDEKPAAETARKWYAQIQSSARVYPVLISMLGYFLVGAGFSVLFGAGVLDALWAGLLSIALFGVDRLFAGGHANPFFRVTIDAFVLSLLAHLFAGIGFIYSPEIVIIGPLMLLFPGLLFTNAMRDIIYGDVVSGSNRLVQVLLTAAAIAIGTAAGLRVAALVISWPANISTPLSVTARLFACFLACIGCSLFFNIHGKGLWLCVFTGTLAYAVYALCALAGLREIFCYLLGALTASVCAELLARVRKYPAISYLVIGIMPLIPGAGIYYTMNYALAEDMDGFLHQGLKTAAIAGVIAVAILLVSSIVRHLIHHRRKAS